MWLSMCSDSFLRSRSSSDHEATAMMKAQFMSLWDGLDTDHRCQVLTCRFYEVHIHTQDTWVTHTHTNAAFTPNLKLRWKCGVSHSFLVRPLEVQLQHLSTHLVMAFAVDYYSPPQLFWVLQSTSCGGCKSCLSAIWHTQQATGLHCYVNYLRPPVPHNHACFCKAIRFGVKAA